MKSVLPLLLLAAISAPALADDHIVLPPVSNDTALPSKMLVFIPGGKVPNTHYISTVKAIQAATPHVRLWAVVPAVFQRLCIISCTAKNICAPLKASVESALKQAAKQGWVRGKDDEDTFLAGHSLGGTCANNLFQAYTKGSSYPYAAVVVMGGYVDESGAFDVTHFPKPVFTLNVELDGGLARPGKVAQWFEQHEALSKTIGAANALAQKPVVVLPKLNHSDFCPGFDVPGDLMAEVSQEEATDTIGKTIGAFLMLHTPQPKATQGAALNLLQAQTAWTRTLLTPYLQAQALERDPADKRASAEGTSAFCAAGQRIVAGLSAADNARVTVLDGFHVSSPNLEHCHPNWTHIVNGTLSNKRISIDTCSHTDYYRDIDNTGEITAASEIACKFLSSDRVAQQLNTTAENPNVDCRAINEHAVRVAEGMAAPSTLTRYKAQGKGWCFLPDVPTFESIGPLWVFKDSLKLKENATCMTAASAVLKTAIDGKIYPGNHYCKVLSPARVLDWMMTDSLKK